MIRDLLELLDKFSQIPQLRVYKWWRNVSDQDKVCEYVPSGIWCLVLDFSACSNTWKSSAFVNFMLFWICCACLRYKTVYLLFQEPTEGCLGCGKYFAGQWKHMDCLGVVYFRCLVGLFCPNDTFLVSTFFFLYLNTYIKTLQHVDVKL